MLLDFSLSDRDPLIEDFCKLFLEKNGIPKFVYGINEYAISIANACEITGFIDDFRQEKQYMGKQVFRLNEVPEDSLIISAIVGVIPITAKKKLMNANLRHLDYFAFLRYSGLDLNRNFLFDFEDFKDDFQKNREKYERIYNLLVDEESKETFKRLVNFRFFYNLTCMDIFSDRRHEQYFEDFLNLSEEEVFLDIGGFDGDTTVEFIKRCPNYKAIYFFEPDSNNLAVAKDRLKGNRDIWFFNMGLYNCTSYLKFQPSLSSGRITEEGIKEVFVDRLDNLSLSPTFIKMDIEGAEREALEGAKSTINKYRPKLAISAYHRFDDLRAIPEEVLSTSDRYSLFIRHYTEGFTETVYFFLPL